MVVLTGTSVFRPILGVILEGGLGVVLGCRVQVVFFVNFDDFDDFDENRRNHQNRVWVSGRFLSVLGGVLRVDFGPKSGQKWSF